MKLIIKLFPEITIKSKSVRIHFTKILVSNIYNVLYLYKKHIIIERFWDCIEIKINNEQYCFKIINILINTPGIHHILIVEEYIWNDIYDIFQKTLNVYQKRLDGKSFCVRVKRKGKHQFTSQDMEKYIGAELSKKIKNTHVKLNNPDETILLIINNKRLLLIIDRFNGIGGYPIGTQDKVISLISGGFDSSISSYMLIRRGCKVNYCFFNLVDDVLHEKNVRQIAYYLWSKYGMSHKVNFISINFKLVVNEILNKIDNGQMSIILKRMMIRTITIIAKRYNIQVLITGESIGQVASQTLNNLRLIDSVSDLLILRPLISYDKEHIINLTRQIGTEMFIKNTPEYCTVVSKKPNVKAHKNCIEKAESKFNFSLLTKSEVQILDIRDIVKEHTDPTKKIEITKKINKNDVVLDIRPLDDQKDKPLKLLDTNNITIYSIPFYNLKNQVDFLNKNKTYLLHCNNGMISRIQGIYLLEQGFCNVKIYQP